MPTGVRDPYPSSDFLGGGFGLVVRRWRGGRWWLREVVADSVDMWAVRDGDELASVVTTGSYNRG
jgi:hypothetical protein